MLSLPLVKSSSSTLAFLRLDVFSFFAFPKSVCLYPFLLRVAAFLLSISFDWPESIKDEAVSFDWLESTEAVPFDWLESIEVVSFDWLESIKDEAISFDWLESIKDEAISFDWLEAIEDEAVFFDWRATDEVTGFVFLPVALNLTSLLLSLHLGVPFFNLSSSFLL